MLNGKKIVGIIQAHMSSTRLPGKIMLPLCGEPALYRMLERVKQCRNMDEIVVATSTLPCDDQIEEACNKWGVAVSRGSDDDVLERYYAAAKAHPADIYIRMTSDCPLIDPGYFDKEIEFFMENNYRYINNGVGAAQWTFPVGCGCEVFTAELLDEAHENSTEQYEHEHVTPYMYKKQTSIGKYPYKRNVSHFRLTLDTPKDYEVITKVYEALYKPENGNTFCLEDILDYLESHPEVAAINGSIRQIEV